MQQAKVSVFGRIPDKNPLKPIRVRTGRLMGKLTNKVVGKTKQVVAERSRTRFQAPASM